MPKPIITYLKNSYSIKKQNQKPKNQQILEPISY